jgi:hypothetical protein
VADEAVLNIVHKKKKPKNPPLKGLSHEIDFKTFDKNLRKEDVLFQLKIRGAPKNSKTSRGT